MSEYEGKMEELSEIRATIEKAQQTKNKLEGELKGYEARILELQEKCQERFAVDVEELADIAEQLESQAEGWIEEAKDIMEM